MVQPQRLVGNLTSSLKALLVLLEGHHRHLHLLHHHLQRIELHQLLSVLWVLVGAVHPIACLCELTHDIRVRVHALFAVGALREKLALLTRVVVRTFTLWLVAVWEVNASDLLFLRYSCSGS